MEAKEWTFERPEDMPDGPWCNEPDKAQWLSKTGFPCIVRRGGSNAWCGYVGVSPGHHFHGQHYNDCDFDVHGGLTFSGPCQPRKGGKGICHEVEPGDEDNVWWLGFDCAHYNDAWPFWDKRIETVIANYFGDGSHYWTYQEVRAETERLAEQLIIKE